MKRSFGKLSAATVAVLVLASFVMIPFADAAGGRGGGGRRRRRARIRWRRRRGRWWQLAPALRRKAVAAVPPGRTPR